MAQKNSDKFEQLGTKIHPAMAEVLNAVCDSLGVDIYHLLQWFAYTLIRAAAPMHRLDPRIQKLMTMMESDAGWQKAFNLASREQLNIAQCILIVEQKNHKGFGAVMIERPFMGDATQTECVDNILETVVEVTMPGVYRRLREMGASMECTNLMDVLLTLLDAQEIVKLSDDIKHEGPQYGDRAENGRPYAYGKKTKSVHHRTPDSFANAQTTIRFNDEDRELADEEANGWHDRDLGEEIDDRVGSRPFGYES